MAESYVKRTTGRKQMWEVLEQYRQGRNEWRTPKTVCVVDGMAGTGKTTWLLNYFKGKKVFYFSFAGLEENLAEKLFADTVTQMTGVAVSGWEDSFRALFAKHKLILLDDLSATSSYKRFSQAFYENMVTNMRTRPFIVMIVQPTNDLVGLADRYDPVMLGYFSVPEVMKLYPKLSKYDILGLCTASGGVPRILEEYAADKSLEENLRDMLIPTSGFITFMPELLSRYFRRPESYHHILCAIANGNHKVSEIGKFCGYAYNKCDNYLAGLIACGFVKVEKVTTATGAEKTIYTIANNYFKIWHLCIFKNYTAIRLGDSELMNGIIRDILDKEIHSFHLQRAFSLVKERIRREFWDIYRIMCKGGLEPRVVTKGKFQYTFDTVIQSGNKAAFVKVFEDALNNCDRDELTHLRRAVELVNMYFDSKVFIFSKRRFSDYAVAQAAKDEVISLVEVDRLKY